MKSKENVKKKASEASTYIQDLLKSFFGIEENVKIEKRKRLIQEIRFRYKEVDKEKRLDLEKLLKLFYRKFYERIWKFRCEVVAEWEEGKNI